MTAQTAPRPVRQVRPLTVRQRLVRYRIVVAVVRHVLRDRRFQATVITGVIAAVALAELGQDREFRPVRRAADWYSRHGAGQELARARQALEPHRRGSRAGTAATG